MKFLILLSFLFVGCVSTEPNGTNEMLLAARAAEGREVCFTAKHHSRPALSGDYCIRYIGE